MCDSAPSCINPTTEALEFEGKTLPCWNCKDGKQYHYTDTCPGCNGASTLPRNGRNYKCKQCKGCGYVSCNPRHVGDCHVCSGTTREPMSARVAVSEADRRWLLDNKLNTKERYALPTSTFNEQYFGIGVLAGYTDYGRYLKMTFAELEAEVRKEFMQRGNHYYHLLDKQGRLLKEMRLSLRSDGWTLYPVFH